MSLENDFGDDGRIIDIDFRVSKWGRGHFGSFVTRLILRNRFGFKIPKCKLILEIYIHICMYLKWFEMNPVFGSRVSDWFTKRTKVSFALGSIDLLINQLIDYWFPSFELKFDSLITWIFECFQNCVLCFKAFWKFYGIWKKMVL